MRHNAFDFWDNPYNNERDMSIENIKGVVIPLRFEGTKLSFQNILPTKYELSELKHLNITSETPWEPSDVSLLNTSLPRETDYGRTKSPSSMGRKWTTDGRRQTILI